jgi:2-desacetyl-2-hydroxyethyl bacteriochlorophyllide A dehydrogenase
MNRYSVWFDNERSISAREEPIPSPGQGEVLVETHVTAISQGTEMVIYRGEAPEAMSTDTTITALKGSFAYPLKYGYAAVGKVTHVGPDVESDWIGRHVFAFHPHESHFVEKVTQLHVLPSNVSPEEAVFLPNMETALTLALDGSPLAGEQVVVFGQGIVGLLLTAILGRFPLIFLATIDNYPIRRDFSEMVGARLSLDPDDSKTLDRLAAALTGSGFYQGADLVYEISGNPRALGQAVEVTGYNGRILLGSWYGTKKTELFLGGDFHRKRILLISSQVSTISPQLSGRFAKPRLLALAWQMIMELKPSRFITHRFHISKAAEAYRLLDEAPGGALQVLITYGDRVKD